MSVTPNVMIDAAHALTLIDASQRDDIYQTLRAIMVTKHADYDKFDTAFALFWRRHDSETTWMPEFPAWAEKPRDRPMEMLLPPSAEPATDAAEPIDPTLIALMPTYSSLDLLRYKNFGDMDASELAAAKALMDRLPFGLGWRRTRRTQIGKGTRIDLRRAMRQSLRTGGEILDLQRRERRWKPRPVVVLCDISGSMERYSRPLLHFIYALSHGIDRVESFVFATRLTRITRTIRASSVDAALKACGATVNDWGSGTRIGESLHTFNYRWGRRVLGRGAVALLITDGWDRGDPDVLRREVERLRLSVHRLIWLNPLLASAAYEPLTRGALALLPSVDDFLPVHNVVSLESLARELANVDWTRRTKRL